MWSFLQTWWGAVSIDWTITFARRGTHLLEPRGEWFELADERIGVNRGSRLGKVAGYWPT
jgi:hypothetical protein